MKYGITNGTSRYAEEVIVSLIKLVPAKNIVVLTDDVERAQQMYPTGVEIRKADATKADSMTKAFAGIKRVLLVQPQRNANHPGFRKIDASIEALVPGKVKFVAYTSFPQAASNPSPLASQYRQTEEKIADLNIAHSFLRNNQFLENESHLIKQAKASHDFNFAAGDGEVGWALSKYYAEAAAKVLASDADTKPVYEFFGYEHTYADLAASIVNATGKDFKVKLLNDQNYRDVLTKLGFSNEAIDFLLTYQKSVRHGDFSENLDQKEVKFGMSEKELFGNIDENEADLPQILKHPLPSLDEQVKDLLTPKPKYLL